MRPLRLLPLALLTAFAPSAGAAQFKLGAHTFTLPDGFEIERVTETNLVQRPIEADFDDQGRLYVTDSSGSNAKPTEQLKNPDHRVVRLEDTDGDGRFDKSTVFADKLMFPEGALWFEGSLYVSGPPSIWKLTDTDGDGVADKREEWHQGKTLTGCANDLHGPYLGLDGWIYWCKGAFAEQNYEINGRPFKTRASHIFRKRADGSGLESVMTGGMDNPVGVAFTAGGERILNCTFFQHPEAGHRDGLIHAIYGGVYGKVHDVLDGHPRTGDIMPVLAHFGPAAACAVIRYQSAVFGDDFRDNLFASQFNHHKVSRHVLEPDGATFRTKDSDFVVSDNTDFHPTDVFEDADGSLLIVDTGGWYKLCCPSSQLAKADVLGGLYRVRRKDAPKVEDPRGLKLAWPTMRSAELVKLLGDPRPTVQQRAVQQLGKGGAGAVRPLTEVVMKASAAEARRNAVWALTRISTAEAREGVRNALNDRDGTIRLAAIHSISVRRDTNALTRLLRTLAIDTPPLQRAAAEALGRFGKSEAVTPLLLAAGKPADRALEHSLTYALIEIGDAAATRSGLAAPDPRTRRAALIALDQMPGGGLEANSVAALLGSPEPVLRQTAAWLVGQHSDWGSALIGIFRQRLATPGLSEEERAELVDQLGRSGRGEGVQALLAETTRDGSAPTSSRLTAMDAMARAGLKQAPTSWAAALTEALNSAEGPVVMQAVSTAKRLTFPKDSVAPLTSALTTVARDSGRVDELRLEALAAIPGGAGTVDASTFAFLIANLDPAKPVNLRADAAAVLSKARLDDGQLNTLADTLRRTSPLELARLLPAFANASDESLGLKLIDSLKESKGSAGLRPDMLKPHLAKFPASVQQQADALLASLNADLAQQTARLEQLVNDLKGGDIRRGQTIFNSAKAACSSCHAMGYLGGRVGPDLTRIGEVRTERDLIESIIYPSASFVRSYEPMIVTTKAGDQYNGIVRKDAPDEVMLVTGPNAEVHVARPDIQDMHPGGVSIMPQGLDQQLERQELADLVAFLRNAR